MENMDAIVDQLVNDIEIPDDVPVTYEVWAIGYDDEDCVTEAELLLGTFEDPDEAVSFVRDTALADIIDLAADDEYEFGSQVHHISVEVETVVPGDDGNMNIGTIYKKTLEIFEEPQEYITLAEYEYEVIEETGCIQVPGSILREYNKGDLITIIFEDEEEPCPIPYKIISITASGNYICEFV